MKRPGFGIVLFAGAAVVTLAVVLLSSGTARRVVKSAFSSAPSGPKVAGGTLTGVSAAGPEAAGAAEIRLADAWKTLDHGDLKALVTNLRAAGFPPKVLRALVAAVVDEQYAARRRQIMGEQPDVPYWKPGTLAALFSTPQMAALRQLAREELESLKQLLGPDSASTELTQFYQRRMFGDLPPDKVDAVQRIQQDYNDLRSQIYADASNGSVMLPWDREKLALLEKEQRDDVAAVLTPDELRQYDLHNSSTAQRLRSQLTYFNPTEQEFLAIYDLQSQFDQSHNPLLAGGMLSPDQMRQRQADQQQLQSQIKATLGDQRYTDYQESTDNGFMAANLIVTTLQLPAQNAGAAWSLQQSAQQQANAIRTDRGMTGDQRTQALQALAAQTDQQLASLLTQPGVDAYQQTPGGMWLRSLNMTTRRVAPLGAGPTQSSGGSAAAPKP